MKRRSLEAIASVAYKEFLHIYRDRRVLLLVLTLPPLFTLLFGHAFETGELTGIPSLLIDQDRTPRAQEFIDTIWKNKTFHWRRGSPDIRNVADLLGQGVQAALVIPKGWNESLENGDPKPLVDAARRLIFLKGRDAHDYKFSSAVLEDYHLMKPPWRDRYLAASVFNLKGSGDTDNGLVKRTRAAIAG